MNLAAYIHPAFQIITLSLGLVTLANGLRVRRSRKGGAGPETARIARLHMRLGRWFITLFSVGYALGLGVCASPWKALYTRRRTAISPP